MLPEIPTGKPKIVCAERAILSDDVFEMAKDIDVVAHGAPGEPADVVAEKACAGAELLEGYRLCLDVAELLSDHPSLHR